MCRHILVTFNSIKFHKIRFAIRYVTYTQTDGQTDVALTNRASQFYKWLCKRTPKADFCTKQNRMATRLTCIWDGPVSTMGQQDP